MTNPMINPQPNYSGVTIQIANPAVNVGAAGNSAVGQNQYPAQGQYVQQVPVYEPQNYAIPVNGYNTIPYGLVTNPIQQQYPASPQPLGQYAQPQYVQPQYAQAYPPQYYLNNYNYQLGNGGVNEGVNKGVNDRANGNAIGAEHGLSNGNIPASDSGYAQPVPSSAQRVADGNSVSTNTPVNPQSAQSVPRVQYDDDSVQNNQPHELEPLPVPEPKLEGPQDFSKSKNIIENLNAREDVMKAEEKNAKQKRVVALTDEYVKSLENYLNNPNQEIRLMASKEILTRLDEDKDRFDDAALNALLNKMLQDPSKLIRIAALSAFYSQLASGNDYTLTLLRNIQNNPSADKEDVLQAADILLKMSAGTEIKNIPNPATKEPQENQNKGK